MTLACFTAPFRTVALGALAMFATSFVAPAPAEAAMVYNVDLGNISAKQTPQDFTWISFKFMGSGANLLYGEQASPHGRNAWTAPVKNGDSFTLTYRFSLYDKASLNLSGGIISGGVFFNQAVSLYGPDGSMIYNGAAQYMPTAKNLQGGDYVLTVSGMTPYTERAYSFNLFTSGGTPLPPPAPGDVPLPGALVLLGTALAGTGFLARRRKGSGAPASLPEEAR